jgi:hypothetical protein
MNSNDIEQNAQKAKTLLDRRIVEIDELTSARLRAVRLRALEAAETRRAKRIVWWQPLSAVALAGLIAVSISLDWWRTASEPTAAVAVAADDMDWLLDKESPDLVNDQLEFYSWLSDDDDAS